MTLIEQAIAKLGSDAEVARFLKVSRAYLSQMKTGVRPLAPFHAAQLAELLEMNPAQVYLEKVMEQAKKKGEDRALRRWFKAGATYTVAALVAVGLSGFFQTTKSDEKGARANSTVYTVCPLPYWLHWGFRAVVRAVNALLVTVARPGCTLNQGAVIAV